MQYFSGFYKVPLLVLFFLESNYHKIYVKRFIHLENESASCDSKLFEWVFDGLQKDGSCVL